MERNEVVERFGTESQCREYIADLRWSDGYRCPRCKSDKAWKTKELKYKCQNCGYKASVTAGTIFQDSHIPLPLWFEAIAYVLSHNGKASANDLQKRIGIGSNRTALSMLHKIKMNMWQKTLEKLQGIVEIWSTNIRFNGNNAFVAVAVERNNKKIGRIRIEKIKQEPTDFYAFVERCIEPHSAVIHREPLLYNEFLLKHYERKKAFDLYEFTVSRNVIKELQASFSTENSSHMDLATHLKTFCKKFNGLKTAIEFHDFMQMAVDQTKEKWK